MTIQRPALPVNIAIAAALLIVAAMAGCAGTPTSASSPTPSAPSSGPCTQVAVVVNFGSLGAKTIDACAPPGVAADVLKAAGIVTAGTADYGDQVVCRVNDRPSPSAESCATLPSTAYWALWVKSSSGDWAYAQDGVATQKVTAGQSLGLVYTQGSDTTPPHD
jgi:hypothetical protein